eukprot:TRINITY_DN8102_c0_g1_i2.p1 TRINITY_DN8102_c0_g1~~TRINITY_DN8102_c0_g1_i2.p1  ORF type:complete len:145 (-),score=37.81 TRINITY_DN8102_c0_g1_i2:50-484(-)
MLTFRFTRIASLKVGKQAESSSTIQTSSSSSEEETQEVDQSTIDDCLSELRVLSMDELGEYAWLASTMLILYLMESEQIDEAVAFMAQIEEEQRPFLMTSTYGCLKALVGHIAAGGEKKGLVAPSRHEEAHILVRRRINEWKKE